MKEFFDHRSVLFLEKGDVDKNLKFQYDLFGKPLVVMMGGDFCPHCKHMAPIFNEFANKNKKRPGSDLSETKVFCGLIQVDGMSNEVELAKEINEVLRDIRGVPTFLLFGPDGMYRKMNVGPMSLEQLEAFYSSP